MTIRFSKMKLLLRAVLVELWVLEPKRKNSRENGKIKQKQN